MRITNSMLMSNYVNNLNKNNSKMSMLQNQLGSGKKFTRSSDDPLAAGKAMEIRTNLSKIKQYSSNVTQAKDWITQTETSLNEFNSLLSRVYELNVKASNATNGEDERTAIANEIGEITEQILVSANTIYAGRYIYGGTNTTQKPFEIQEDSGKQYLLYNGEKVDDLTDPAKADVLKALKSQKVSYEIGFGASMDVSYNGIDVMGVGEDNLYAVLNNLKNALLSGDNDVISSSIGKVDAQKNNIISLLGEIGGKSNRLDAFSTRLENDEFNYSQMQQTTEGVDMYQVLMELQMQDVTYQAALASGSRIIQRTLADFLG